MGPYKPTLIIHGGAGNITRSGLPPELYTKYHSSLLKYLMSTNDLLHNGADAVEAACHAVSMMEDDPLFNCGRGSVFTIEGGIEMEASLMVASINDFSVGETISDQSGLQTSTSSNRKLIGRTKKNAAVSMIKRTRHPILLAREVLAMADGSGGGDFPVASDGELGASKRQISRSSSSMYSDATTRSSMHGHLSGSWIEEWGFKERGLERKGRKWFWTRKRWEEHRRGLGLDITDRAWKQKLGQDIDEFDTDDTETDEDIVHPSDEHLDILADVKEIPSQGTVGAVCMDSWGNLCVATSTGGLTNKRSGRVGDTPSVGAGFWAESWNEELDSLIPAIPSYTLSSLANHVRNIAAEGTKFWVGDCLPETILQYPSSVSMGVPSMPQPEKEVTCTEQPRLLDRIMTTKTGQPTNSKAQQSIQHRAVALSGTGNGDSFLRVNAARTAACIARLSASSAMSEPTVSLQQGVTAISGPGGELEQSAGDRWGKTGEGEGGIIGIEATRSMTETYQDQLTASVVFDFNCGGMWRAYYEVQDNGKLKPKIMVFKTEYTI